MAEANILSDGLLFCGVTEKASGQICKWPSPDITYSITGFVPQMTQSEYRAAVRRAFDSWEAVCGLRADEVSGTSGNLILQVGRGRRNNFDGPSGVLAWCEIPCGSVRQCQLRMDLDEQWTDKSAEPGIFVDAVLAHEIGHGIGLYHIESGQALMNQTYKRGVSKPMPLDASQVLMLYGTTRPRVKPEPKPEPKPDTPQPPTPGRHLVQVLIDGRQEFATYVG